MWSNEPRSLPDWIEDVYQILVSETPDQQTEFSHNQVQNILLADEDFPGQRPRGQPRGLSVDSRSIRVTRKAYNRHAQSDES